jgi:hypothetical protein
MSHVQVFNVVHVPYLLFFQYFLPFPLFLSKRGGFIFSRGGFGFMNQVSRPRFLMDPQEVGGVVVVELGRNSSATVG